MNNQRRKTLADISAALESLREQLGDVHSEEQDAFDNMPEGLQDSERGQKTQEAIEQLDSAFSDLESAIEAIGNAME